MGEQDSQSDEVEKVIFNSANFTGHGTQEIVINGQTEEIHRTGSFPTLFRVFIKLKSGEPLNNLETIFAPIFNQNQIGEIIEIAQQTYPNLFNRMADISTEIERQAEERNKVYREYGRGSPELQEFIERQHKSSETMATEYIFSMGYDALAEAAFTLGEGYLLENLRVLTGRPA